MGPSRDSTRLASPRRVRRVVAAIATSAALAGALLVSPGAAPASADGSDWPELPSDDAFYSAPAGLAEVEPGTVLRSRPVTVRGLGLPMPVKAWQVLYRSTDAQGRPNAVSGTVAMLDDGRSAQSFGPAGRPLVAYNVGTHGLAPKCAPSFLVRKGEEPEEGLMAGVVGRGWAIMVTDYEGSGTPGPHTYTSGLATGRAVLDGARAALRLEDAGLGRKTPVGLWGYSEGGLASAWAAELAAAYAPELDLVGTAAGGVPANLLNSARRIDGGPLSGFILASAVGLDRADPRMRLDDLLNPEGRLAAKTIARQCVYEWLPQFANHPVAHYTKSPDPLAVPRVKSVIRSNHLGRSAPSAPMFVYEGVHDQFIAVDDVRKLVRTYCAKGVRVAYTEDAYGDHISTAVQHAPAALDWLAARFGGQQAPDTC
jgi:hypothetical protein